MNVMEDTSGNHSSERARIVQLVQSGLPVERPLRGLRVDREHVVTRGCERWGNTALAAAADLEHALRRRG
jgi:hypothetical protein